ncbi:hypothetical protein ACP275_09G023400 [Erythranthe tilingii]
MKISELHDKESKEMKPKTKKESKEMKPKTKKRKLLKKSTRVSRSERKSRVKKSSEEKSKKRRKLSEEELMERTMIYGGTVVEYDRDDSSRYFLGEDLESLVNLAIDFYNTNNGSLYYMTMKAKLPNQDDSDAVTFEAEVYEGIPDTVVHYVRVLDDAPPLSPLAA